jgi:hypothetical protein
MRLVAKDVAGRLAAQVAPARAPRESLRRSMSWGAPPRGPRHRRLQEAYRARRIRRFLPPEVHAGELAFDVGANVGEWSAVMRRAGARVVAVEPQADCARAMREHFAGDPGIVIVESAVGDWVGSALCGRRRQAASTPRCRATGGRLRSDGATCRPTRGSTRSKCPSSPWMR